jgi:hypothetical protein
MILFILFSRNTQVTMQDGNVIKTRGKCIGAGAQGDLIWSSNIHSESWL